MCQLPLRTTTFSNAEHSNSIASLRKRVWDFLQEQGNVENSAAPELIEVRDENERFSVKIRLRKAFGDLNRSVAEITKIRAMQNITQGYRSPDGLAPPEGTILRNSELLPRWLDGHFRSCLILGDENELRISEDNFSGGHFDMAQARPVRAAGEIAFFQDSEGLVLKLNPRSGTYNDLKNAPASEEFNSFEPLIRILDLIWEKGLRPYKIVISDPYSREDLATFRQERESNPWLGGHR